MKNYCQLLIGQLKSRKGSRVMAIFNPYTSAWVEDKFIQALKETPELRQSQDLWHVFPKVGDKPASDEFVFANTVQPDDKGSQTAEEMVLRIKEIVTEINKPDGFSEQDIDFEAIRIRLIEEGEKTLRNILGVPMNIAPSKWRPSRTAGKRYFGGIIVDGTA